MAAVIKDKIKENQTLAELLAGIVCFGIVCQIVGAIVIIIFLDDGQLKYAAGLWIGIISAILMTLHSYHSINKALDQDEKTAAKMTQSSYFIRYGCAMLVLAAAVLSGIADPLVVFLGMMGRKIGAYMQPLMHRAFQGKENKE